MAKRERPTGGWRFWVLAVVFFVLAVAINAATRLLIDSTSWGASHPYLAAGLSGLSIGVVGAPFTALIVRRRLVGRLEGALREPGGKWRHGRLTVTPGLIVVEPYRRQTTLVRGTREEYRVGRIGDDTGRRPPRRQLLWINPQLHIVDLDTDRGPREIALLPAALATLRERLAEPSLAGDAAPTSGA